MQLTTISLDIAKNVFQIHGVAANGEAAIRRKLRRIKVIALFKDLAPSLLSSRTPSGPAANLAAFRGRTHDCSPNRKPDHRKFLPSRCRPHTYAKPQAIASQSYSAEVSAQSNFQFRCYRTPDLVRRPW